MQKPIFIYITLFGVIFTCCKKKETLENTIDNTGQNGTVVDTSDRINPNSIIGLHNNIFKPTCANSGCHDGTFEPDFRTVESAYNTLVMQPIVKNNPEGTFTYRVVPGDAVNSVLYKRITDDIDGQSGIMPLSVDPGSDYTAKRNEYIQNIKTWINEGAKDLLGNPFSAGNQPPTFTGASAFYKNASSDTVPIIREGQQLSTIPIPYFVDQIELWIAFNDDGTLPRNFTGNTIRFSTDPFNFNGNSQSLEIPGSVFTNRGFVGQPVEHSHRIVLNRADFTPGLRYYFRVNVSDDSGNITEIPNDSSPEYIKVYFTLKWEDGE